MKRIVIIDFGSQVTQLIARRIRELQVYCELYPHTLSIEQIKQLKPNGIILSGGPNSVYDEGAPKIFEDLFSLNIPILGICYGMQMIAHLLGGKVISGNNSEFGHAELNSTIHNPLWEGLPPKHSVWMSHGDHVETLPEDFVSIASTDRCPIAAMKHLSKPWFGVQFHPEVTHTTHGHQIIRNFVLDVCQMETTWTMPHFIDESIEQIKKTVGSEHVVLGLSGGVDSSVAAALIHRAIGHQLHCVFVDTGLLRLHEGDQVMTTFAEGLGIHVIRVNAEKRFFSALKGIHDPEEKRKIIGKLFVDIFQEEASSIPNAQWLAQGTIYPDVIESAGQKDSSAHTIKSHHNVGGLPDSLSLKLLEPLRKLFKDEVRELGLNLSLPSRMIFRHPFPGPGLGVRILGEIRPEYADILRFADAIFMDVLHQTMHEDGRSWYEHTSQAFAVFLPVKSVGVMGDGRTYDYVIALRAVVTQDFMTAHWAPLPYELLAEVSNRIINQVPHVNRVVYDISGKPPATIEWE